MADVTDRIRPMLATDLTAVLSWRNQPEVRRYMFSQHEISSSEHQRWFEAATTDSGKHLLIFEADDSAQGFVQFSRIRHTPVAEWGFYLVPGAVKGMGRRLGQAALKYAFSILDLHKVSGQALGYNAPSIGFHRALGFSEEGILRDHHFDGATYHDVYCFGLLASDWKALNETTDHG